MKQRPMSARVTTATQATPLKVLLPMLPMLPRVEAVLCLPYERPSNAYELPSNPRKTGLRTPYDAPPSSAHD
jgi:hypothetical protein